jgi:hypothetical protein
LLAVDEIYRDYTAVRRYNSADDATTSADHDVTSVKHRSATAQLLSQSRNALRTQSRPTSSQAVAQPT